MAQQDKSKKTTQDTSSPATTTESTTTQEVAFAIQRIYTKDLSYEAPHAPAIFRENWQPEVKIDLKTENSQLAQDVYEVVLRLTVTVTSGARVAFLIEAHQAGIFTIQGLPEDQLAHAIGSACPNILFPYARETISDMVTRGGFPQLLLAPINFDALFLQHVEQLQKEQAEKDKASAERAN